MGRFLRLIKDVDDVVKRRLLKRLELESEMGWHP